MVAINHKTDGIPIGNSGLPGKSGTSGTGSSGSTICNLGAQTFNAVTGGNDSLKGTAGSDFLDGAAGSDQIQGLAGNDTLIGGAGNDRVDGGSGVDRIFETRNANFVLTNARLVGNGTDTLLGIEGAWLVGGSANNTLNAAAFTLGTTTLDGAGGNDRLTGGAASDTLLGGSGDDTISGASGNDSMAGEAGKDLLSGGAGNDQLLGGSGKDTLDGGAGNDTLAGEAGNDRLAGGAGDDTYVLDKDGTDQVLERVSEGTDRLLSWATCSLPNNVENLTLLGATASNATGNTLANILNGNAAANVLNGRAGIDTLQGGAGDDSYVVDNTSDKVVEGVGQGTDTVESSVSYSLPDNVEKLRLTGIAAINATGNGLANLLIGNAANNVLTGHAGMDTLQGGMGNDTYVLDSTADTVVEGLGHGSDSVRSSATYTLPTNVENLILVGPSAISGTGNELANTLTGNAAANVLNGGAGIDTLHGGAGHDIYVVDNARDSVVEGVGQGVDTVQSSVTYTLADHVENLTLTGVLAISGTGNQLANTLRGNTASNTLLGGLGDDLLDGGAGTDILHGGIGDDTYVVDNKDDKILENAGEGTDTVLSSFSYALEDNLEKLTLTGAAAINGTGNALANSLTGNSANNTLDGGVGADLLQGGVGNDAYLVDDIGDRVVENVGQGTDWVFSAVTCTLAAEVENLTLTGILAIDGTGNELGNILTGNSAANILRGAAGDDTYVMDNVVDEVIEGIGGGTDTVLSSVTYLLPDNVENLTLTGSEPIDAIGNSLANLLTGNVAANVLTGGVGDDRYGVDNVGDQVVEDHGGGRDTVMSLISYQLAPNTEDLILTGTAAINGRGNLLDNSLTGNVAANVLDGGVGADLLRGGEGADIFVIGTIDGGVDGVLDFESGIDKLFVKSGVGGFNIGNGDETIDGATLKTVPGSFLIGAEELVIFSYDIVGQITAAKAAAQVADVWYSSYGDQLFVFDNGVDSAVFKYDSLGIGGVHPSELTLITMLQGTAQTVLSDYLFG